MLKMSPLIDHSGNRGIQTAYRLRSKAWNSEFLNVVLVSPHTLFDDKSRPQIIRFQVHTAPEVHMAPGM